MGQSDTRERLLSAGKRVIFRKGFHRSRVSDITSEAGVAHGTFYIYFRTKEDLLLELLRSVREELIGLVGKGLELVREGRHEEAKEIAFVRTFELLMEKRELAKVFFFEAVCTSERFQEFYSESKRVFTEKTVEVLKGLGVPNPETRAHVLIGTARHLIENLILGDERVMEVWREVLRELGLYH